MDPGDLEWAVVHLLCLLKVILLRVLTVLMASRKESWERLWAASPWNSPHDEQGAVSSHEAESVSHSAGVNARIDPILSSEVDEVDVRVVRHFPYHYAHVLSEESGSDIYRRVHEYMVSAPRIRLHCFGASKDIPRTTLPHFPRVRSQYVFFSRRAK